MKFQQDVNAHYYNLLYFKKHMEELLLIVLFALEKNTDGNSCTDPYHNNSVVLSTPKVVFFIYFYSLL